MPDARNIEGGIRDEHNLAGSGCTPISIGGMRDSFGIDCGMWDLNSK